MKRSIEEAKNDCEPTLKSTKYTVHIVPPTSMPSTNFQERHNSNDANTAVMLDNDKQHQEETKQLCTIQTVTMELIEKNPFVHLGVHLDRMPILKHVICRTAGVILLECYITLKKLRTNESFSLLAQYFEISEVEVREIFRRTVIKLARYMRFLICWPEYKKYTDRHKALPFAFRQSHLYVQSLMECVETVLKIGQWRQECNNYKYLICFDPTGIITYISDVYIGQLDDICIIEASNFKKFMPQRVMLVADPGKAIRRKQESCKQEHPKLLHSVGASTSTMAANSYFDAVCNIGIGDGNFTDTGAVGAAGNAYNSDNVGHTMTYSDTEAVADISAIDQGTVNGTGAANITPSATSALSCNLENSAITSSYTGSIANFNNVNENTRHDQCNFNLNNVDAACMFDSDADDDDEENMQSLSKYAASQLAGEFASQRTLTIVNDQLTSKFVDNFSIPIMQVSQNLLRSHMSEMIKKLQEFKLLQNLTIDDMVICECLNEILVVCAGLTNLQK